MDVHASRAALLKITFLVLIGTSWIFSSFIFATRPEAAQAQDPLTKLVRLPASIPGEVFKPAQAKPIEPVRMETMHLPCWDKVGENSSETGARWIRLTGKDCENGPVHEITVRNLSNGYMATVFATQLEEGLTTDFIPLETGKNQIQIRFQQEPGTVVENQFTLLRR